MSLNKFTDTKIKDWMNIGCNELNCNNLESDGEIKTDEIKEKTPGNGVLVDGLLIKDSSISCGTYMSSPSLVKYKQATGQNQIFSSYFTNNSQGFGLFHSEVSQGLYFSVCDLNGNFGGTNILSLSFAGDVSVVQSGKALITEVVKGKAGQPLSIGQSVNTAVNIGAAGIDTTISGNLVWAVPHSQIYGGTWSGNTLPNVPMANTTICSTIDTNYRVNFGTSIVSTMASNFTNASDGRMTYTGSKTRMFHCAFTISATDSKASNVSFSVFKNNSIVQGSTVEIDLGSTSNSAAIHTMMSLSTNDYLDLYVRSEVVTNNIVIRYMNGFAMALTT
jgi:hypothetical protein